MILSCDDGCVSDMRLADLAAKYEVDAVFYWPVEWQSLAHEKGYRPLRYDQAYDIAKNFEIGSHTITHRHLTKMVVNEAYDEIALSKPMLESLFNKPVVKFCPPRGYTNEGLTDYTLQLYESQRLTKGDGLVHIHPDSGANNNRPWREVAKVYEVKELWCHSWELNKYDLWVELEEFLNEHSRS